MKTRLNLSPLPFLMLSAIAVFAQSGSSPTYSPPLTTPAYCPLCDENSTCQGDAGTNANGSASSSTSDGSIGGSMGAGGGNVPGPSAGMTPDKVGVGPMLGGMPLDFQRFSSTRIPTQNFLDGRFGQGSAWVHNFAYAAYDETDSNGSAGTGFSFPTGEEIHFRWSSTTTNGSASDFNEETGVWVGVSNVPYKLTVSGSNFIVKHATGKKYTFQRIAVPGSSPVSYFYRIANIADPYGHKHTFSYDAADPTATEPLSVQDGTGAHIDFNYAPTVSVPAADRFRFVKRGSTSTMSDLKTTPWNDEDGVGLVAQNTATPGAWMHFEITNATARAAIPACSKWAIQVINRTSGSNPLAVAEMKFYDENGVELTASSGTPFGTPGEGTNQPANLWDGDTNTYWKPVNKLNTMAGVSFTAPVKVRKVSVFIHASQTASPSFQIVGMQTEPTQVQKILGSVQGFTGSQTECFSSYFTHQAQGDVIFGQVNLVSVNRIASAGAVYSYDTLQPYSRMVLLQSTDQLAAGPTTKRYEFYKDSAVFSGYPLGLVWKSFADQNGGSANVLTSTFTTDSTSGSSRPVLTPGGDMSVRYTLDTAPGYDGNPNLVSNGNPAKIESTVTGNGGATRTKWFTYTNGGAGYVASVRENNGNLTEYVRNSMGLPTSIKHYGGPANAPVLETNETIFYSEHLVTAHFKTNYVNGVAKTTFINNTYNADGQLTSSQTTGGGIATVSESWTYGSLPVSNEKVINTHTFPDGSVEAWNRDANTGKVIGYIDRHGGNWTYSYLNDNYETGLDVTDPYLQTTHTATTGNAVFILYPNGMLEDRIYEAGHKRLMDTAVTLENNTWNRHLYTYDGLGRTISVGDYLHALPTLTEYEGPNGQGSCSCNNGAHPTQVTDPAGRIIRYLYDGFWQRTATIVAADTADALRYDTEYDSEGRVTRQYLPYSPNVYPTRPASQPFTEHTYDARGRRLSTTTLKTDAAPGWTTSWTYDGVGNVLTEVRPTLPNSPPSSTTNTYDLLGRLLTSTVSADGVNQTTSYQYNAEGRVTQVTTPAGRVTTRTYANGGLLASVTVGMGTADAATTNYSYVSGRLDQITAPDGKITSYTYDNMGRTATVTADGRTTTNSYHALGHLTTVLKHDGTSTARIYDSFGYGQLDQEIDENGHQTNYTYTEAGELQSLTDASGHTRTWTYNKRGQLVAKTWPDTTADGYTYDTFGRLETHVAPAGGVETYAYNDGQFRLTGRTFTNTANPTPSVSYEYDAVNRVESITSTLAANTVSELTFGYDGRSRKISETQSIPEAGIIGIVGTTFDSDGNPASLTYPDGRVLNYTYSARSQLKTVTPAGAAAVATYTYDTAGRPTQVTKANGANTAYGYNPTTGDLTSVLTTKSGQTVDGVSYTLDPANGRRTGITRSSNAAWTDTYGYDPAGQVTSGDYVGNATLTDEDFVYDPTGNRTSHTQNGTATAYTPNALDQYSAIATLPQGHDLNGNMIGFIPPATGATPISMAWDEGNQLIGASRAAEGSTEARNVLYRYDALGRRILKQVFDPSTSPPTLKTTTAFIYDGWNVIEERELTTSTKYRYTWGADVSGTHQRAGGDGGLLMAEATVGTGATEAHYYHYDGNGNVIALTNTSGTREARYRYTAFGGNAYTEAAPLTFGADQPYRFSTKYLDREIEVREGMYYYGYRYYLTCIGRWPNRDPIGERGGRNLLAIAGNKPISYVDTDGRGAMAGVLPIAGGMAAADGPLPILDIVAGVAIIGAGIYDLSQPGPGTGNCSTLYYGILKANVDAAKLETGILKGCNDSNCCWVLKIKKTAWLGLAAARSVINDKCFDGGDAGHQQAAAQAWQNVVKCGEFIASKCN